MRAGARRGRARPRARATCPSRRSCSTPTGTVIGARPQRARAARRSDRARRGRRDPRGGGRARRPGTSRTRRSSSRSSRARCARARSSRRASRASCSARGTRRRAPSERLRPAARPPAAAPRRGGRGRARGGVRRAADGLLRRASRRRASVARVFRELPVAARLTRIARGHEPLRSTSSPEPYRSGTGGDPRPDRPQPAPPSSAASAPIVPPSGDVPMIGEWVGPADHPRARRARTASRMSCTSRRPRHPAALRRGAEVAGGSRRGRRGRAHRARTGPAGRHRRRADPARQCQITAINTLMIAVPPATWHDRLHAPAALRDDGSRRSRRRARRSRCTSFTPILTCCRRGRCASPDAGERDAGEHLGDRARRAMRSELKPSLLAHLHEEACR